MTKAVSVAFSVSVALATAIVTPLIGQQPPANPLPPPKPETLAAVGTAARGAQLVMLGGCHDCHTPKLPNGAIDFTKSFMGHPANAPLAPEVMGGASTNLLLTAWRGPWGMTLARNLTPDKDTGIGTWTLADFKKTLRTGVNPKGEVLMPPMPVANLQNLPDSDIEAIFRHLRTIRPISNRVGRPTGPGTPPDRKR